MKKTLISLSVILVVAASCVGSKNPVLKIDGGKIQGILTETPDVYLFKGIPYAAPPVGDLRWKPPQPVVPWEGVKLADTYGPAAMQPPRQPGSFYYIEFYTDDAHQVSEDCLYLNISTPAPGKTDAGLPVAIYIHGGAYASGYCYEKQFLGGEEWAKHGVILVTINYRLNIFGYFSHPALSAESPNGVSGNYGLLDQIAALKWVRNNIRQFGGDPDNITVFGQSAGAMSIQSLITSDLSKDLMNKAIMESGGGVSERTMPGGGESPLEMAEQAGKDMMDFGGYNTLEAMRAVPAADLLTLMNNYRKENRRGMMGPVVDGYVLTKNFSEAALKGEISDIPYIIGFNKDDIGMLKEGYGLFCRLREASGKKTYAYEFMRELPGDSAGAFHSAELWYVFNTLSNSWRPFTDGDYTLSEYMVDAWTNFAKYGNPNGKEKEIWSPYTKENQQFMILTLDSSGKAEHTMGLPSNSQ